LNAGIKKIVDNNEKNTKTFMENNEKNTKEIVDAIGIKNVSVGGNQTVQ
jgi:hypothetical protein